MAAISSIGKFESTATVYLFAYAVLSPVASKVMHENPKGAAMTVRPSAPAAAGAWHTFELADIYRALGSAESGLTVSEAQRRLEEHGPNELLSAGARPAWHTLVAQFKNVLVLILLAATAVSGVMGHTLEAVVIAVIVLFAVLLGFVQEYRAERALEALREMAAPLAHALRGGVETQVPARELVSGDAVVLRAGEVYLDHPPVLARCTDARQPGETACVRLVEADPETGRIAFTLTGKKG